MTAVIAGVRFHTDVELFEPDDGYFDLDVTVAWVTPSAQVAGDAVAGPDRTFLWVDRDEHRIHLPDLGEATAERSWQLRQAAPIVAACFNRLTLHASAVDVDGVVAFVGETGVGKSTLAWALAKAGALPVADDVLPIRFGDTPHVPTREGPKELRLVAALSRSTSEQALTRLTESDAMEMELKNGFGEHGDTEASAFQFDAYHRLVMTTPHCTLTIPDDRSRLDDVTQWLPDAMSSVVA